MTSIRFEILGEPASKANSRQLVTIKGRPAFIKSKKARDYVKSFQLQCPNLEEEMLEGDLWVDITIYYASRRPDLDESVILDCMQGFIYKNDRQVKEKWVRWGLDKEKPRAEIYVGTADDRLRD
jgi:Holliday junction resolvase RusA-like endonuclease|tara:strand:+ start:236 stop:607 length:372 start_codon:yes stop_codon:yes gene_type:complete